MTPSTSPLNIPDAADAAPASYMASLSSSSSSLNYLGRHVAISNGEHVVPQVFSMPSFSSTVSFNGEDELSVIDEEEIFPPGFTINPNALPDTLYAAASGVQFAPAFPAASSSSSIQSSSSSSTRERLTIKEQSKIDEKAKLERRREQNRVAKRLSRQRQKDYITALEQKIQELSKSAVEKTETVVQSRVVADPIAPLVQPVMIFAASSMTSHMPTSPAISTVSSESSSSSSAPKNKIKKTASTEKKERNKVPARGYRTRTKTEKIAREARIKELEQQNAELIAEREQLLTEKKQLLAEKKEFIDRSAELVAKIEQSTLQALKALGQLS